MKLIITLCGFLLMSNWGNAVNQGNAMKLFERMQKDDFWSMCIKNSGLRDGEGKVCKQPLYAAIAEGICSYRVTTGFGDSKGYMKSQCHSKARMALGFTSPDQTQFTYALTAFTDAFNQLLDSNKVDNTCNKIRELGHPSDPTKFLNDCKNWLK